MNTKAVINNVKRKGIKKTLEIRKKRKAIINIEDKKKIAISPGKIMTAEFSLIDQIREADECEMPMIKELLRQLDGKEYKTELKRFYVKNLLPQVYEERSVQPVEDKIIFLQPRRGLNPSCKYIYNKLKSTGKYNVKLHSLKRGEVSTLEYYFNAARFVQDAATAKAVFVHESNELLGYVDFRPETKVVQLWHGCGIIKSIGMSNAGKKGYKSVAAYKEFPEYNKYDLVTMASEELRWVFEEFMGMEKGAPVLQATGVSRTDEFFDQEYIDNCYEKLYDAIPEAKNKKVILYAPTYRGLDPNRVAPNELDIAKFAEALDDDYILIIKHHQTAKNLPEIDEKYKDSFAFDMTRGRGMNINELMTVSDICISDYSSLVYEFSLFERPIIFFDFDLEDYQGERGMYYTYEELAEGGPILKTNEEVIAYIKNLDTTFDKEKVIAFKNKYMSACDGHATERIIDFIEQDTER